MKNVQVFPVFVRRVLALTSAALMVAIAAVGCAAAPVESEENVQASTMEALTEATTGATAINEPPSFDCCWEGSFYCSKPGKERGFGYVAYFKCGTTKAQAKTKCMSYCNGSCDDTGLDYLCGSP